MSNSTLSKRRGKYGRSKFRSFLVIEQLGGKRGRDGYLSTRELCILAGLPYRSLSKLLPKWTRFEYVLQRPCLVRGRGDFEYKLAEHGSAWLKVARERLRNRDKFFRELQSWVNGILPAYQHLLGMRFDYLVLYIGELLTYPVELVERGVLSFDAFHPLMNCHKDDAGKVVAGPQPGYYFNRGEI